MINSQTIPQDVVFLLKTLEKSGYNAHIVGGCVRDVLMQKIPYDWDICTNALPQQICETFKNFKLIKNGIKHGTVAVILNSEIYEITTYRIDSEYLDNRHPQEVSFVNDIKYDLERRDFTINALAYNEKDGLIDLFEGQNDIKNKIIKAIGNPDERFSEDALRIMRALRFSQTLGFEIEKNTKNSILKNKELLKNISEERLNQEFVKILLSDKNDVLCEFSEVFNILFPYNEISTDNLKKIKNIPQILHLRLGAYLLCCDFDKTDIRELLYSLRFDKSTIKNAVMITENYTTEFKDDMVSLKMLLKKLGQNLFSDILTIKSVLSQENDLYKNIKNTYEKIMLSGSVFTTDKLSIDGNDLKNAGITDGKSIGFLLDKLVDEIILNNTPNTKEVLLKKALEINNSMEVSK